MMTTELFDLRTANLSMRDRHAALGVAASILAATSVTIALGLLVAVELKGAWIDSSRLLLFIGASSIAGACAVGAVLIRSNLSLLRSMTVDGRAIQLSFHDGSRREVSWSDPGFEVEFVADSVRGNSRYVMYGRSWGRLLIVSKQAFESVLKGADSLGMRVRRTGFGSGGAVHLVLMPAASGLITG